MSLTDDCQVIALTGAFGSGCSTAAHHLSYDMGFELVRLSDLIREECEQEGSHDPDRRTLQRTGDQIREQGGREALVTRALTKLRDQDKEINRVVFDGVKNRGEIDELRRGFGFGFTLFGVTSDQDERWDRLEDDYRNAGKNQSDFLDDDQRDQNEESTTGQEVQLCMDAADVIIANSGNKTEFKLKVARYAEMALGLRREPATEREVFMHLAFSSRHSSKCIKRHVGAIVVDQYDRAIAVGYNENPRGTLPCVEEPKYVGEPDGPCFRDIVRNAHFQELADAHVRCPECGETFGVITGPPWLCPVCKERGVRTNLEQYFFPDRAMHFCTAIHAEQWALAAAGDRARGGQLFSTTFPCMQCAEKIIHAGIARVVYTEAYPDTIGRDRFELAGVAVEKFEGVCSSAFERFYGRAPEQPA